jgi:hypothetical protein
MRSANHLMLGVLYIVCASQGLSQVVRSKQQHASISAGAGKPTWNSSAEPACCWLAARYVATCCEEGSTMVCVALAWCRACAPLPQGTSAVYKGSRSPAVYSSKHLQLWLDVCVYIADCWS